MLFRSVRQQKSGERESALAPKILALLESLQAGQKYLHRLVIKSGGRVFFLRTEEIDWIEAAGNYVRLHAGGEAHLLRETMNALESQLDPKKFLRIHRSTIVHIERIQEMHPWFKGEHVVILRGGTRLTLSRGFREKLQRLLGKPLLGFVTK